MYVHWRERGRASSGSGEPTGRSTSPTATTCSGSSGRRDELTWYVDGVKRFRVTAADRIPHVPMEVLVNLAVGVPEPPPPSVDSARMHVDWVRVWQH